MKAQGIALGTLRPPFRALKGSDYPPLQPVDISRFWLGNKLTGFQYHQELSSIAQSEAFIEKMEARLDRILKRQKPGLNQTPRLTG